MQLNQALGVTKREKQNPAGVNFNASQAEMYKPGQVKNNEGAFVFKADKWSAFDRFLKLGTAATFYNGADAQEKLGAQVAQECFGEDPARYLAMVRNVRRLGLNVKSTTPVRAAAIACYMASQAKYKFDWHDKCWEVAGEVCKTGDDLAYFVSEMLTVRGWGRTLRTFVGEFYNTQSGEDATYQALKYQRRHGQDVAVLVRNSHPNPRTNFHRALYGYLRGVKIDERWLPDLARRVRTLDRAFSVEAVLENISPAVSWEMIPSRFHQYPEVWTRILNNGMPSTALLRQLGRMTSLGVFSDEEALVAALRGIERIGMPNRNPVHPIKILTALRAYKSGKGESGLSWWANPVIVTALENALEESFSMTAPLPGKVLIAVDVSESMTFKNKVSVNGKSEAGEIVAYEAATVLALALLRSTPGATLIAFNTQLQQPPIGAGDTFMAALFKMRGAAGGGTDCSVPFRYMDDMAKSYRVFFDNVIVITDNETNARRWSLHPAEYMRRYMQDYNPAAKLAFVATTVTEFSLADGTNPNMLDVAGFGADVPAAIHSFMQPAVG